MSSNTEKINKKNDGKWSVGSESGLWESMIITVENGYITGCNVRGGMEIGSNFESMLKYWKQFDGENKYLIEKIKDE